LAQFTKGASYAQSVLDPGPRDRPVLADAVWADEPATDKGLGGTSWQLVVESDGNVVARIDCNRGRGTWESKDANQLTFGPMATTRAMCPPGSMHDRILKDLPYVRSYVLKDGHLFLALMAHAGIYELEPTAPTAK
jgi:heat shock protein HslJ